MRLRFVIGSILFALISTSAAGEDLRERRVLRGEPPWWRRALAAPEGVVDVIAWPIKKSVIWAERVNLPERVRDVFYFNDERTAGWFPNFELGGEIGPAAGVKVFHKDLFGAEEEIMISTLFGFGEFSGSELEEKQGRFLFAVPPKRSPFGFRTEVFAGEDEDENFFVREAPDGSLVVGGETGEDDETTYAIDIVRVRVQVEIHPVESLMFAVAFRPLVGDVEAGRGRQDPPIPETIDGVGGPIVILGGGPVFEWDGRDDRVRPRWGPYFRAEGGYWKSSEGSTPDGRDFQYARYTVEAEQHLPTFRRDRTLALQVKLDRVEPQEGDGVPFWDLPALDEDHLLRGFKRNRFRDEGAILVNLEYRYPIWDTWDGYLFVDEGQVFREYADVDFDRFEWSAGAGVRFYSSESFLLRVHFAVSEEERKFRFGLSQEF